MKIDFLKEISYTNKDDAVVRIYDFTEEEARKLADAISWFVNSSSVLDLSKLDFISTNVSLSLEVGETDMGIREVSKNVLVCSLTKTSFAQMVELIKPFGTNRQPGKYQYLYDTVNPIELIISSIGDW